MSHLPTRLARVAAALLLAMPLAHAQAPKPTQWVYMLKVSAHLHDEAKWSNQDKAATGAHFARLQKAAAEGKVILAGRSTESLDKTFGLVVFEAENEAAAKAFMEGDPAVKAGVMTATLHPYAVALQRK